MAVWLPALKMLLPYVATVATAAIPAFTQRREGDKSIEVMSRQITELQQAAEHNAESVRVLAEQLQTALNVIELAGEQSLRRQRYSLLFSMVALLASLVTLAVVLLS
jgi:uncharacterized coiled-coil protein SlyX